MSTLTGDAQPQGAHPHVSHPDQDDPPCSQDEEDSQMQAAADSLKFLQSADLGSSSSLDQPAAPPGRGVDGIEGSDTLSSHSGEDMPQADADSSLADADALDALLSLTADCSMQCPRQAALKPDLKAGDCTLSPSASWATVPAFHVCICSIEEEWGLLDDCTYFSCLYTRHAGRMGNQLLLAPLMLPSWLHSQHCMLAGPCSICCRNNAEDSKRSMTELSF